ncbi:MAG: hypothetical protein M3548_01685 [Actinomycetota bacterium]|nr:hypothetical protein [Actinomycetota bacterium]
MHDDGPVRDQVSSGIETVPAESWDALAAEADIDLGRTYLRFREHLEPGDPVLLLHNDDGPAAALHGSLVTDRTGLFSHPWKLLTSGQVLRATNDELARREAERDTLIDALTDETGPAWQRLSRAVGATYVVRGYDSSELIARPGVDVARAADRLLALAQRQARTDGWGAVVLPFVREDDEPLREGLARAGFRSATITGVSDIPVSGASTVDEFVRALPSRRRYRYRKDFQALDATDHRRGELSLERDMDVIVEMEAGTMSGHGGSVDPAQLRAARRFLVENAPDLVRVPAVSDASGPFACGVHLVGRRSYLVLTFGADYRVRTEDSGGAYHWVTCHAPVEHCCATGLERVRLGFESFEAKAQRGAVVVPRQTWFWLPDSELFDRVAAIHDLVSGHTTEYLGGVAHH